MPAPQAVLLVVTDPPEPARRTSRARKRAPHAMVLSAGTYLDSQRFRVHLGRHFSVDPAHVEAQVIGDHGTAQVFLWSSGAHRRGFRSRLCSKSAAKHSRSCAARWNKRCASPTSRLSKAMTPASTASEIVAVRIAEMVCNDETRP